MRQKVREESLRYISDSHGVKFDFFIFFRFSISGKHSNVEPADHNVFRTYYVHVVERRLIQKTSHQKRSFFKSVARKE